MGEDVRRESALVRSSALALVALGLLALGGLGRERWPSARAALDCEPRAVHLVEAAGGPVATCGPARAAPPAPVALALGLRLDLNRASARELSALPGVGRSLARRLVQARAARGGRFQGWDEVDAVAGVGEAKLQVLQRATELR